MRKPSKIALSVASAVILGLAALTGCGGADEPTTGGTPDSTTGTTQPAGGQITEVDEVGPVDPAVVQERMNDAIMAAGTFKTEASLELTSGDQTVVNNTVTTYDMTDPANTKAHQVMTGSMELESIIIGQTMYTKMDDGTWEKTEMVGDAGADPMGDMQEGMTAEYVGIETVDGVETLRYDFKLGTENQMTVQYFLDNEFRPVVHRTDAFGTGEMVETKWSGYGEPVTIEAPPADQIAG